MVRMEVEGRDDPIARRKGLLIDGADYFFLFDGKKSGEPFRIETDPSTTPMSINVISGRGKQLGIYQFTREGHLQICLNRAQGKGAGRRPAKFTTKPAVGAGSVLYTLKKAE